MRRIQALNTLTPRAIDRPRLIVPRGGSVRRPDLPLPSPFHFWNGELQFVLLVVITVLE
jgi:hypothetical protein